MASTRSQRILTNVQRVVDKTLKSEESTPEAIYDAINAVQEKIIQDTLCVEGKTDLTLYGQELYSLPDDFISLKQIMGDTELMLIDLSRVAELRVNPSDSETISYYFFHDSRIGFLTSAGSYPASGTLTMYYYRQIDDAERCSHTIDPVINKRWDRALFYGAVCELLVDGAWEQKYLYEFKQQKSRQVQNVVVATEVKYNSDYD